MSAKDCTCDECVGTCKRCPGWFAPGEAEKAAALLGMPFDEFKRRHLITDYWSTSRDCIDVLAPVKLTAGGDRLGGTRASFSYAFECGRCTFLDENDRCRIHAAKPRECREAMVCEANDKTKDNNHRRPIVAAWAWFWRRARRAVAP